MDIGLEPQRYIKASMWQGIEQGRKCEIDYLNGYIVSKGFDLLLCSVISYDVKPA